MRSRSTLGAPVQVSLTVANRSFDTVARPNITICQKFPVRKPINFGFGNSLNSQETVHNYWSSGGTSFEDGFLYAGGSQGVIQETSKNRQNVSENLNNHLNPWQLVIGSSSRHTCISFEDDQEKVVRRLWTSS